MCNCWNALSRCYSIYQLVKGITSVDEVNEKMKPKLTFVIILSIIYDLPRLYLNVNLFGALCSFYYILIKQVQEVTTLSHTEGECQKTSRAGQQCGGVLHNPQFLYLKSLIAIKEGCCYTFGVSFLYHHQFLIV